MAKGYHANQDRLAEINRLGKDLAKRAGFRCEWCESKDELRPWDYAPNQDTAPDTLALLCNHCRQLAKGADPFPTALGTGSSRRKLHRRRNKVPPAGSFPNSLAA